MSQPVLLKSSIPVAVIRLLQGLLAAAAAPLVLYVLAGFMGRPFDASLIGLAAVSAALALVIFQPRTVDVPVIDFDALGLTTGLLARWALTLALLYAIGRVTGEADNFQRGLLVAWAVLTGFVIVVGQLALVVAMRRIIIGRENVRSAVIVGVNAGSVLLARQLRQKPEYCTQVVGFFDDRSPDRLESTGDFPLLGQLPELLAYVRQHNVEVIFVALPLRHIQRVMQLLDDLRDSTASIYYIPDVFAFDLIQSRSGDIGGVHIIAMYETPFYGYRGVLKRLTDIAFTLCILAVAAIPMLLISLLIKLTSRGPVIFKQRRYGLDGQEIVVYKFRSMKVMEDGGQIVQATKDDKRNTWIGKYLRRYSLDELPQLINVLQGRMSLVGPRPHAVAHNETYRQLIKGYMMRHKVLPGITGLAQVSGCRGETRTIEQMQARVSYDLDYLRQWTPALDFRILVKTLVMTVLGDKQAY